MTETVSKSTIRPDRDEPWVEEWKDLWIKNYEWNKKNGMPVLPHDFINFIRSLLSSESKRVREEVKHNIGMLRQWLNEKPKDRLVTNEDIETWLFDSKESTL